MNYQIELVARAFYDAEEEGCEWDVEPEILKEEYRRYARNALALLQGEIGVLLQEMEPTPLSRAA